MTVVEMSLTIASGLLVAAAVLLGRSAGRAYGAWSIALLFAFTALTALSVVWSVQPDDSFKDAGRMLSYCAVFGAVVMLARTIPARWPAVLGGIVLAAAIVCGYAVLTKVFPAHLDAGDVYARLRAPYNYWNAIGLTAAMGAIGCLWLGARRAGHALATRAAYPAMGLMLLTLMLAYSRGALVSLLLGLVLWFCIVPLRLRGAAILLSGAIAAGAVVVWDFSTSALDDDNVALAARTHAGHQLGALVLAMLLVLSAVGLAFGFWTGRQAPSLISRRRAGTLLLSAARARRARVLRRARGEPPWLHRHDLARAALGHRPACAGPIEQARAADGGRQRACALLERGAEGVQGPSGARRGRGRLCDGAPALPHRDARRAPCAWLHRADARRPRHRRARADARAAARLDGSSRTQHASAEPALEQLARARRLAAAAPGARPPAWRRFTLDGRPAPYTAERVALLSMLVMVVVFGIHSLADWTWYVPGDAIVALLCAGWLAGRGPLEAGRR